MSVRCPHGRLVVAICHGHGRFLCSVGYGHLCEPDPCPECEEER